MENSARKRRRRWAISLVLLLTFVGLALWYADGHRAEFAELRLASWGWVLVIAACFFSNLALRGFFNRYLLTVFSVRLGILECVALTVVTSVANLLLPMRGGAGFRAVYLKRLHQLPYSAFVSTLTAFYILFMFVNTGLGLAAILWIWNQTGQFDWVVVAILAASFAGSGVLMFCLPDRLAARAPFRETLNRILLGFGKIRGDRRILSAGLLTELGTTLLSAAGLYAGFRAFSISVTVPSAFALTSSQTIGSLMSLTPGAIGFQEMLGMYFSTILEATPAKTLVVLLSVRVIRALTAGILGVPSILLLAQARRSEK